MTTPHITALLLLSSITLIFVITNVVANYFRNMKIDTLFKKIELIEVDRAQWKQRVSTNEKEISEISKLVLELNNYHIEIDRLKNQLNAMMVKHDEMKMSFDIHQSNKKIHNNN